MFQTLRVIQTIVQSVFVQAIGQLRGFILKRFEIIKTKSDTFVNFIRTQMEQQLYTQRQTEIPITSDTRMAWHCKLPNRQ